MPLIQHGLRPCALRGVSLCGGAVVLGSVILGCGGEGGRSRGQAESPALQPVDMAALPAESAASGMVVAGELLLMI